MAREIYCFPKFRSAIKLVQRSSYYRRYIKYEAINSRACLLKNIYFIKDYIDSVESIIFKYINVFRMEVRVDDQR